MPHDLIVAPDQFQMGTFLGGWTTPYDLVKLTKHPATRVYKADVPGGGSYVPRVELAELGLILDLEVHGTSADDLETKWTALEVAFAPALDAEFAWREAGTTIRYVNAHVETPPIMVHDHVSDTGHVRVTVIGLVASDPTIHTV